MPDAVEISVVVPCSGGLAYVEELVDGLARQDLENTRWEAVFVDNGLEAGTRRRAFELSGTLPNSRWVQEADLRSAGGARNRGATEAIGDILAFIDADDVPCSSWLSAVTKSCRPGHVVAGQLDLTHLNPDSLAGSRGLHDPADLYWCEGVFPVVPSGNFSIAASDFERVGGFDPQLEALEDFEFSKRLWQAGIHVRRAGSDATVHYRLRSRPMELFRQGLAYGRARVQIYAGLWKDGLVPRVSLGGWKAWVRFLSLLPMAPFRATLWSEVFWILGNRIGRVLGSFHLRVLYL